MPEPVSDHITTTPNADAPYDATSPSAAEPWKKMDATSGPADLHSGRVTGEFESSPPWQQV
jgi:hypothetical protein